MGKMPMVKKSRNPVSSNLESKVKVGLSLTPSSADRLNSIARKLGISRSELLERLAQGALDISSDKSEVSVTWKKGEETEVEPAQLEGETAEESEINDAVTAEIPSEKVSIEPNPLQASYESLQHQLTERESLLALAKRSEGKSSQRIVQLQQELATEKQNLASQSAETVTKSSYESLQQELATEKQNLASQLAETVTKSSYESLQNQLAEKESALALAKRSEGKSSQRIVELQQQLATEKQNLAQQSAETVTKSSYESLQQELATEKQNLAQQLAETVTKSSYESLQNQLSERESSLAQLQQELATEKQNLASQLAETVSKSSYESLQHQLASEKQNIASQLAQTVTKSSYQKLQDQLAEKESAIGDFQVQLTKLQYLENQLSQSVAKQRNYDALQQQSQEQLRTIKALREQLGQMQAVAGIGEAYLNKWRRP